jgi:hypothetical protein
MNLEKSLALFARCINSQDYEPFRRVIDENAVYESYNHLYILEGPDKIIEWLAQRAREREKEPPEKQIAAYSGFYLPPEYMLRPMYQPCVLVTRGDRRNVETVYAMRMRMGKVARIQGLNPHGIQFTRGAKPE